MTATSSARVALAVAVRPRLWAALPAFVPSGWWRRPPFLPVPGRDYLRFRTETMYGPAGRARPEEVVAYLEWCLRMRRSVR